MLPSGLLGTGGRAAATIFAKNYLARARVLAESLRRHHPEVPLYALLWDEVEGCFVPEQEPFRFVAAEELPIPDLPRFRFQYTCKQGAAAAKPYLLRWLIGQGFESVLFLDPDMWVLDGLEPCFEAAAAATAVLTPHILSPLAGPDRIRRELNLLQSGVYNAGFLGVGGEPEALPFLEWWMDRVYSHCLPELAEGMYYDQRWLDLAPVFFPGVRILRDPGCNVAHWNLPEREVRLTTGRFTANGQPLRLAHFSGFDPGQPERVTRYSERLTLEDLGDAAERFRRYAELVENAGFGETRDWPHAYERFTDGTRITPEARRAYRSLGSAAARFGDPRDAGRPGCFKKWLDSQAPNAAPRRRAAEPDPGGGLPRPLARAAVGEPREPFAAGSIASRRDLPLVRVLGRSLRQFHPEIPFYVLLTDEVGHCFRPEAEPFRLLRLEEVGIPDLPRFRFHYNQQELTYASTPYLLRHLLDLGYEGAGYFKQESLVLGDLTPVLDGLRRHSILLTPHLLQPLPGADRIPRELNILQSGVYNVGFLGVAARPAGRDFLDWWQDRLYTHCRHDVPNGMHFEQRWLDLVPALWEDVGIVRDPGFNVGHWNLPERRVELEGESVRVDGAPGRFLRLSGFDPEQPDAVTRYNARLTLENVGGAADLFRRYVERIRDEGYAEAAGWPYAYGSFDNGEPVTEAARRLYRAAGAAASHWGDPLRTGPGSFHAHLQAEARREARRRTLWARGWRFLGRLLKRPQKATEIRDPDPEE